jgi:3-deoxy-D-manno-octulosonic-acid transferase
MWSSRHGPEYATVYWFVTLTLFGWMASYLNRDFGTIQVKAKPRRRVVVIHATGVGRVMGRAVLVGPLAGLAGLLPWMVWTAGISGDPANRLVAAIFLFIVSWALLAFWVLASSRPWRPMLSIAGLIGLGGILMILGVHG